MTDEETKIMVQDLCARLPYGVIVHFNEGIGEDDQILTKYRKSGKHTQFFGGGYYVDEFKPYLRSLASMTEKERAEYATLIDAAKLFDFLNAHHFDYRGLIEKGLALEAPEGMYNG